MFAETKYMRMAKKAGYPCVSSSASIYSHAKNEKPNV